MFTQEQLQTVNNKSNIQFEKKTIKKNKKAQRKHDKNVSQFL